MTKTTTPLHLQDPSDRFAVAMRSLRKEGLPALTNPSDKRRWKFEEDEATYVVSTSASTNLNPTRKFSHYDEKLGSQYTPIKGGTIYLSHKGINEDEWRLIQNTFAEVDLSTNWEPWSENIDRQYTAISVFETQEVMETRLHLLEQHQLKQRELRESKDAMVRDTQWRINGRDLTIEQLQQVKDLLDSFKTS